MNSVIQTILKKKRWAALVLLFAVMVFPFFAHAKDCAIWEIGCGINNILRLILEGLAVILSYIAQITDWAIQPSPITTSYFVEEGWKATRDFANMFFILILLGIALDFILFNSFGVKRALPKLLIIALLINFSIPIAGVLIDFANVFTSFFLDEVSKGGFTGDIAQSVGLQRSFNANNFREAAVYLDTSTIANDSFLDLLFAIGMIIGMIFIFLALAAMFLIRTGYISVLLVLLPIALVLSAFPPTSKHFSKWISKFTQWTMFAPAAAFFLYLSLLLLNATGNNGILSMGGGSSITEQSKTFTVLRYVMAWGLMLMSLTTAQSMGITGAGAAMAMWSKGTKWARGRAYGAAKTGAIAAARRTKVPEGIESTAKGLQKMGLGVLASGVRGLSVKTKTAIEKHEELTAKKKAEFEKMSRSQRQQEAEILQTSKLAGSGAKLAQLQALQAQKGELNVINQETGEIDLARTRIRIKAAYENAFKNRKDKKILETLMYANPTIGMEIMQDNWKKDVEEGKLVDVKREDAKFGDRIIPGAGNIINAVNRETGEMFEEKLKEFKYLSSEDMKNAKGTWTPESVATMMGVGGIDASFVRKAAEVGDTGVLGHIENYLKQMTDIEKRREFEKKLKKHNPGALNDIRSGGMIRFGLIVPKEFLSEKGKTRQESGMVMGEEY